MYNGKCYLRGVRGVGGSGGIVVKFEQNGDF